MFNKILPFLPFEIFSNIIEANFPFTNTFISMLGYVKDAAARANKNLKLLEAKKQRVISRAAKEVWTNKHGKEFPIDVFQTGSRTSLKNINWKLFTMLISPYFFGSSRNDSLFFCL